jgi:hypothetical protein
MAWHLAPDVCAARLLCVLGSLHRQDGKAGHAQVAQIDLFLAWRPAPDVCLRMQRGRWDGAVGMLRRAQQGRAAKHAVQPVLLGVTVRSMGRAWRALPWQGGGQACWRQRRSICSCVHCVLWGAQWHAVQQF